MPVLQTLSCTCVKLISDWSFWSPLPQICRANQGITCLTEGYGAWQQDSLTSWWQPTTATLSVHLQDPKTFSAADIRSMEAFHDGLQFSTMYPATVMHRRSNLVQLRCPPVLTDPCFFSGGHLTLPPCHCPLWFTWIPPLKVIVIASIDDTQEIHCVLCLYLWQMQHLVIYSRLFGK